MTKRREQDNYNAIDRFVLVADVSSRGVGMRHHTGTETFDHIWRTAGTETTHLVLRSGSHWIVANMSAFMNDNGIICMRAHKLFTDENAAIMYATMMASQEKEVMDLINAPGDMSKWFKPVKRFCGVIAFIGIESDNLTHN